MTQVDIHAPGVEVKKSACYFCHANCGVLAYVKDGEVIKIEGDGFVAAEQGVHVEVTTLVIPGKNDGAEEMAAEAEWLAGLSAELPLHLSRYFPRYRSKIPMTPVETLQRLRRIAGARLRFVHLGNV